MTPTSHDDDKNYDDDDDDDDYGSGDKEALADRMSVYVCGVGMYDKMGVAFFSSYSFFFLITHESFFFISLS